MSVEKIGGEILPQILKNPKSAKEELKKLPQKMNIEDLVTITKPEESNPTILGIVGNAAGEHFFGKPGGWLGRLAGRLLSKAGSFIRRKIGNLFFGKKTDVPPPVMGRINDFYGKDLSHVNVRKGGVAGWLLGLFGYKGITLGNTIYLKKDTNLESREGELLLAHEMAHIMQIDKEGSFEDFAIKYGAYLVANGYEDNPYEVTARDAENEYNSSLA